MKRPYKPRRGRKRVFKKKKTTYGGKISLPKATPYAFKRQFERNVFLNNPDTANGWYLTGDNAVVKTFGVALDTLTQNSEFTDLFRLYKLNYMVVEMFPSHTTTNHANALANNATYPISNTQMLVSYWRANSGIGLDSTFTQDKLLQLQNKKTFMTNGNRPIKFKMYLNQLSERWDADTSIDTLGVVKPKYISTTRTGATHYGINIHVQKTDNSAFNNMDVQFKVRYTVYLTCKQVQ